MEPVVGVFASLSQAQEAAARLRERGFGEITLLTAGTSDRTVESAVPTADMEQPGMGPAMGGVVGGALGVAGGLELGAAVATLLVPGVGPVIAMGLLAAAVLGAGGAAAGVAAGSALEHSLADGLPKDELFLYEDALRHGKSVLICHAEDEERTVAVRGVMTLAGAETLDAAREQWWIGLRPVEEEHYSAEGHDFVQDEDRYRHGFEAALNPDFRGQRYEEAEQRLRQRYRAECDQFAFRRGYERGSNYYRSLKDSRKS
jgi:hypothetical protein